MIADLQFCTQRLCHGNTVLEIFVRHFCEFASKDMHENKIFGPSQNDEKWIDSTHSKSNGSEEHSAGSLWEVEVATFWWSILKPSTESKIASKIRTSLQETLCGLSSALQHQLNYFLIRIS